MITMMMSSNTHYHAHFYFDQATCQYAETIHVRANQELGLKVGRFHRKPVGPHTLWSFEIDFNGAQFESVTAWLEQVRAGHSVLVHPVTDDELRDHTDSVHWLGEPVSLDLSIFK
ncbi:DOPA 4,5-dioxygenase family protein [Vibrio intestinalis]|uniref:DOPA 4,5-dioxygenase family protein n=1 Tax=Vibrio intestinalis TaxID=2933291 RepID=UPI002559CDBE|nr:DOPA 4,5-dioxygenase family protein [Vibrio intestinalis]